jgi:hypothetical protein
MKEFSSETTQQIKLAASAIFSMRPRGTFAQNVHALFFR